MGYVDDVGQKIKGKVQKAKGEFNQKRGKGVKGGLQKLKGEVNERVADIKLRAKDKKRY